MFTNRRFTHPLALACLTTALAAAPTTALALPGLNPPAPQSKPEARTGVERNPNPTATARGDDIVLRRDGSKAVPFEPYRNPTETRAKAAEGFDWGDAGLGAGALVVVLGAAGALSLRGRQVAPMARRRADDALQKRSTLQ